MARGVSGQCMRWTIVQVGYTNFALFPHARLSLSIWGIWHLGIGETIACMIQWPPAFSSHLAFCNHVHGWCHPSGLSLCNVTCPGQGCIGTLYRRNHEPGLFRCRLFAVLPPDKDCLFLCRKVVSAILCPSIPPLCSSWTCYWTAMLEGSSACFLGF